MTTGNDNARLQALANAFTALPADAPAHRFPQALADVIREQGLWKLWVPAAFGGEALGLPRSLRLFHDAGRIDGSIGFAIAIGTGGGLFAAYLPEKTAAIIYSPRGALIAGSGAPTGHSTPVAGGYEVTGHWRYASLIGHATWVTANTRRSDTEAIMAIAVPAAAAEAADDWHVHALGATDSRSVRLTNQHVSTAHTFSLSDPPRLDAPIYRFPFEATAATSFAAVTVGTALGAVEAFTEKTQARRASDSSADSAHDRRARATGLQQAAASHLMTTADAAWDELLQTGALSEETDTRVHLAAVTATRLAVQAVDTLADVAGMALLDQQDRFSRAWRDVRGMAQHAFISRRREGELGRRLALNSPVFDR